MKAALLIKKSPAEKSRIICRRKFLYYFPKGFEDSKYISWERGYKWQAHLTWQQELNREEYQRLLSKHRYLEIAQKAVRIESRTNLLFSFEKMALRDAVRSTEGAKKFARGLFDYIHGAESLKERVENFAGVLAALPRRQTRVLTWPLQTIFGFIANPKEHIFLKPRVTQEAARKYAYSINYTSKPNWETYQTILAFAKQICEDVSDLKPRDLIDIQSFIWVAGSDEYDD
jgi:hypothetical protein